MNYIAMLAITSRMYRMHENLKFRCLCKLASVIQLSIALLKEGARTDKHSAEPFVSSSMSTHLKI